MFSVKPEVIIRTRHMIWGAGTSRHKELDNKKYDEKTQENKEDVSEDQDT